MQWVLVVLLYLGCFAASVLFVSMPLSLIVAPLGFLVGVSGALFAVLRSVLLSGLVGDLASPAEPGPSGPGPGLPPDPAWRGYFVCQVWLDLVKPVVACQRRAVKVLDWLLDRAGALFEDQAALLIIAGPLLLWVPIGLIAVALGALAGLAFYGGIVALVTALVWVVAATVSAATRGADWAWQHVHRAEAVCPRCYYVTRLPAYQCPGPHPPAIGVASAGGSSPWYAGVHFNIRAGTRGVWWRRCGCGERLPTSLLRAAGRVDARCPRCIRRLDRGAGLHRSIRVGVLGASRAGKTYLVSRALVALCQDGAVPGDEHTDEACRAYGRQVGNRALPAATPSGPPTGFTLRIAGLRPTTLHLYDPAGTDLLTPASNRDHFYLDTAHGLVFVVDPMAVSEVRESVDPSRTTFTRPERMADEPLAVFHAVLARLRDVGVPTTAQRLAVVVSKADQIAELVPAQPASTPSAAIRDWLRRYGQAGLVDAAELQFREVRFFMSDGAAAPAAAPLRWLLGVGHHRIDGGRTERVDDASRA